MSKGLTREQIHQVKEAFDIASFCKKWWKSIAKEMKKSGISKFQKLQVLMKLVEGLVTESYLYCESIEDESLISETLYQLYHGVSHE